MKRKYRSLLFPLAAAAISLPAADAFAQDPVTKSYCDPSKLTPDASGGDIVYNSAAKYDAARGMWLTQDGDTFKAGTAFYKDSLLFKNNMVDRSFWTYFRFHAGSKPSLMGGNGLTFIMHQSAAGAKAVGANDNGMGFGGITESVVFEFDTHADEMAPDHLSLMLNGDQEMHRATANTSAFGKFSGAANLEYDVWIEYDHTLPAFQIYMAKVANASDPPAKPAAPLVWAEAPGGKLPADLDLGDHVLTGWVGFTSATGALTNNHEIHKWEFSTGGIPCDCAGATATERDAYCGKVTNGTLPTCNPVDPNDPTGPKICGCVADAQCPAYETAKCDAFPGSQECVPCTEDANCAHFNDPLHALCADGVCGECKTNADCPMDRPTCDPNHQCTDACSEDADCPTREVPRCDTAAMPKAKCDKCVADSNCTRFGSATPSTPICGAAQSTHAGICVQCNTNADCKDEARPACLIDEKYNECVECVTNDDCTNPLEPVCDPTAHKCEPAAGRVIAGGGCSLSQDSTKSGLAALGAAVAAALAFSRRRRRG
jgi:MYXO-CTERM domain-containing protein